MAPILSSTKRQTWPRPLWLHLGSAWNCLSSSVNGWMMSQSASNPQHHPNQSKNQSQSQKQSLASAFDAIAVGKALAQQAATQWQDFLQGLYLYQQAAITRTESAWDIITQKDAVALKRLKNKGKSKDAILLIPSLINRFHILDLHPDQSFVRYLQQQGHDVYLIDWHHDLKKPLPTSLEACITKYIVPLMQNMPQKNYHLLGYCMGGTLGLAAAILNSKPVKSLTLIATPWDFHQPDAKIGTALAHYLDQVRTQTSATSLFKADWLQMLFWRHDPLTALHKFQRFKRLKPDSRDAEIFVLAEDWLNDGVDLPVSLLHDCVHNWYGKNLPALKKWRIGRQIIDPATLKHLPLHIIAAQRDGLVPADSAKTLTQLKHAKTNLFDTGHIGLFAGAKSAAQIWPQVQHFLAVHNTRKKNP